MASEYLAWGGIHRAIDSSARKPRSLDELREMVSQSTPNLAFGNGRSYADQAILNNGCIIDARNLDHALAFDKVTGKIRLEAGVLLGDIQRIGLRRGFMLSTTPGTQYVTLGGAIANDVHGKNHHAAGSIGCSVEQLAVVRSTGDLVICSRNQNEKLFHATIGGMGLTGVIAWADLQLREVPSPYLDVEVKRYRNVGDFFDIAKESESYESTVAWVDCSARGGALGRGIFERATYTSLESRRPGRTSLDIPLTPPISLVNRLSISAINRIYLHRTKSTWTSNTRHYTKFFYPLDHVRNWNRMYGPRGFYQFQNLLPFSEAETALVRILELIQRSGQGSFLVVLKTFGTKSSGGYLSFPRPGATLAIDFPNRGKKTTELLGKLLDVTMRHNGVVYPAKSAVINLHALKSLTTRWDDFQSQRDFGFDSELMKRLENRCD